MPPRQEEELDPVSLCNLALMNMEGDPTGGFRKMNFLMQNPPFPPETFGTRRCPPIPGAGMAMAGVGRVAICALTTSNDLAGAAPVAPTAPALARNCAGD
jgi:hypothetical protein